jgi:hypothetical protein
MDRFLPKNEVDIPKRTYRFVHIFRRSGNLRQWQKIHRSLKIAEFDDGYQRLFTAGKMLGLL